MPESRFRLSASAVRKAVKHDIEGNTHVTSLDAFLDRFFPQNTPACQAIFETLQEMGQYNATSKTWSSLPCQPGKKESAYYAPITFIMNAIAGHEEVGKLRAQKTPDDWINATWIDTSMKAPGATTNNAPKVRPDVSKSTGTEDESTKANQAIMEEIHNPRPMERKRKSNHHWEPEDELSLKLRELLRVVWARTIHILEGKPTDGLTFEVLLQLGSYIRQIFREQPDRMFVFGIILLHKSISIWYCDRSGLLGTEDLINMDEAPLTFIRVIFNLATMSPQQLGYNPYMKRVLEDGLALHSYDARIPDHEIRKNRSDVKWRFTIPFENAVHEYDSICLISASQMEVMRGRATMAWSVKDNHTKECCVLKHCWRPIEQEESGPKETDVFPDLSQPALEAKGREASLYQRIDGHCMGSKKLVAGFDLPRTSTLTSLRNKLPSEPHQARKQSSRTVPDDDEHEQRVHQKIVEHLPIDTLNGSKLTNRQLSWMVFSTIGRPVKYFLNLKELLATFEGALQEYQKLYNDGIVHRDISVGNILIKFEEENGTPTLNKTSGTLIDLDHAKHVQGYEARILLDENNQWAEDPTHEQQIERFRARLECNEIRLRPSSRLVSFLLRRHPGNVLEAVVCLDRMAKEAKVPPSTIDVDFSDLGLYATEETCVAPDFTSDRQEHLYRSGTPPFVSHMFGTDQVPHSAIHDVESFFWVLLYICITRGGPCGLRRNELATELTEDETDDIKKGAHRLTYCFFDADQKVVLKNKDHLFSKQVFTTEGHFDDTVLRYIHPYFNPLKELIRDWWTIIFEAHRTERGKTFLFDYPVGAFLQALSKCQQGLEEDPEVEWEDLRRKEEARRRSYLEPSSNHAPDMKRKISPLEQFSSQMPAQFDDGLEEPTQTPVLKKKKSKIS